MKKLILFFILFIFSDIFYYSYSYDSTAAKFYPLAIGNLWSYHQRNYQQPLGCTTPTSQSDYIVSIVKDTLRNGHKYYKFSDGRLERIDSSSMNVYRVQGVSECIIDSLLGRKNDNFHGCNSIMQITDTGMIFFAGQNRRSRTSMVLDADLLKLVFEIGKYAGGVCSFGSGTTIVLNGCIINGIQYGTIIGVTKIGSEIPKTFSLYQNYPNPFNPTTKINYQLPKQDYVRLTVYDVLGNEVAILVSEKQNPGTYDVNWDGSNHASGVYFYKIETGMFVESNKMVLIK